ncbi:MAG: hypothetical protein P8Z80_01165 [Pseudolabrys sp.]
MAALICAATVVVALQPAMAGEKHHQAAAQEPGFFERIERWFDRHAGAFKSTFGGARTTVEEFGREAGMAATTTVDSAKDAAKDAADAVGRLPSARVVSGYEKCRIAPNGAPDCGTAADSLCRAKGYKAGSSVDMTTAEVCPPKIYLAGRSSGPGCHTETFVSSALCR